MSRVKRLNDKWVSVEKYTKSVWIKCLVLLNYQTKSLLFLRS